MDQYFCHPTLIPALQAVRRGELYFDLTTNFKRSIPRDSTCGDDVQVVMSLHRMVLRGDVKARHALAYKLGLERMHISSNRDQFAEDCAHLISIYVYS